MAIGKFVSPTAVTGITGGINFCGTRPAYPMPGDCYFDAAADCSLIYTGVSWVSLSAPAESKSPLPTEEQLEKHPALKQAWEEYLVVKRLLGV